MARKPIDRTFTGAIGRFVHWARVRRLRKYQRIVLEAITDSILNRRGMTFVVIFPRQSGKNEMQAQIETYLLTRYSRMDGEIVKVSPTWKPQSLNAMRRLERVIESNRVAKISGWKKEQGYVYRVGSARIYFLSGSPTSNVVGATASTLLECDEAQDVLISKWDKDIAPMAASTNATRVFWGTAWTTRTLLYREKIAALEEERRDGRKRVFVLNANTVAKEAPAYGKFVKKEVRKHGRNHPMVRSQFFSEEIDAQGGMFPPQRQALMVGMHPPRTAPELDMLYAFLLDVAGEDEGAMDAAEHSDMLNNPGRDATALTIVEVELSTLSDELIKAPTYLVVYRKLWMGTKHTALYGQLRALADLWQPRYLVVDATGVGAGLASFLEKAYPQKVLPFVFSAASKSRLGWQFVSIVETGRFKDHVRERAASTVQLDEQELFWQQVEHCQIEISPGPERRIRWGVPDGMRDQKTGELVHDDLLLSAALCAVLDDQEWGVGASRVVPALDPLADMGEIF